MTMRVGEAIRAKIEWPEQMHKRILGCSGFI